MYECLSCGEDKELKNYQKILNPLKQNMKCREIIVNGVDEKDHNIEKYALICKKCYFENNRYNFEKSLLNDKEARDALKGKLRIKLNLDEYIKDWNECYFYNKHEYDYKKIKLYIECGDNIKLDCCYNKSEYIKNNRYDVISFILFDRSTTKDNENNTIHYWGC